MFQNPSYSTMGSVSVFNPRYNTPEQIEEKYHTILNSNPLPLIKIISNHDFNMVERILQSAYKTVFIYPEDLRKQVLKVLVAKKTDSFVDKDVRKNYIDKLVITKEEIKQRLEYYKTHMTFKDRCDYVTSDKDILTNPSRLFQSMGLDYMGTRYKYKQYEIKDEDMLENIDDFNRLYEECIHTI